MNTEKLTIQRQHRTISFPVTLPDAEFLANLFGFLVKPGESLSIRQFADRIDLHYDNPRTATITHNLRMWSALVEYATDHVAHFDALPVEFEYEGFLLNYQDCLDLLGERAVDALLTRTAVAA